MSGRCEMAKQKYCRKSSFGYCMEEDKEKEFFDKLCEIRPSCRECFCNDLCMFLLLKTGVTTTCSDFRRRVGKVVDREMEKLKDKLR